MTGVSSEPRERSGAAGGGPRPLESAPIGAAAPRGPGGGVRDLAPTAEGAAEPTAEGAREWRGLAGGSEVSLMYFPKKPFPTTKHSPPQKKYDGSVSGAG